MNSITQTDCQALFKYNSDTGILTWRERSDVPKNWNTRYAGTEAGSEHVYGYRNVCINYISYPVHRIVWLYVHGSWPNEIDHINRVRNDNRLINLRSVTRSENNKNHSMQNNNTTGITGVTRRSNGIYEARISINGKRKHLGQSRSLEKAIRIRILAEKKYGYHPNHGRQPCT